MYTITVLYCTYSGNFASADRKASDHIELLGIHTVGGVITFEL
jgi:ammonia channel protein AmtB